MSTKTLKKGDVIQLPDGTTHKMVFAPVEPTGKGQGKVWEGITDDNWKDLYDALRDNTTKQRNFICEKYHVSYQKLRIQFQAPDPLRVRGAREARDELRAAVTGSASSRIAYKLKQIERLESDIARLKADIADLKVEAMEELTRQIEELDAI